MFRVICASSIFILSFCLNVVNSGGPVYISPQQAVVPPPEQTNAPSLLTQTVYGFLDFTTTIGNTVMVFSPQSAPADGGKPESKPSTPTVIETKPPATSSVSEIAPSKTVEPVKTEKKVEEHQKPSIIEVKPSIIEVKPSIIEVKPSIIEVKPSIIEVKPSPQTLIFSSIVEVRGGPATSSPAPKFSSIVEVRTGSSEPKKEFVSSRVEVKQAPSSVVEVRTGVNVKSNVVESPKAMSSIVNVQVGTPKPIVNVKVGVPKPVSILSSKVEVISSSDEPAISGNNLEGPAEYDFLSRQPSEVVDETYKVYDIRPNTKLNHKNRVTLDAKHRHVATKAIDARHPVGLVTSMGGTVVKDGVTTVHETKVIGTYISGKYAQVLQSTSQVFQAHRKPKPTPVNHNKILKTAAPTLPKGSQKPSLEPTPVSTLQEDSALPLEALFSSSGGANLIRTSRRPAIGNVPFKNRFNRNKAREETKEQELEPEREPVEQVVATSTPTPSYKKNRNRVNQGNRSTFKLSNNRFARPSATQELATVSVYSEPAPANNRRKSSSGRRSGFRPSSNAVDSNSNSNSNSRDSRRGFKPKPSAPLSDQTTSTSVYKFKLQRPSGRWQYKTTAKPRINIRRQDDDNATLTLTDKEMKLDPDQELSGSDVVTSADQNSTAPSTASTLPIETIKVEISTPAEFKNTYYEIATIKSPYTFQVGTLKNTRYITVTSTLEKSLVEPTEAPSMSSEPLTENILVTTANAYDKEPPLDSSVATLPPIALAGDAETPPLETMTETFSTTQLLLKTHLLPVVYGGTNTSMYTLVQSYHITRIVSAIKTLPPMEVYQFVPSKTLNEFNTRLDEAGSELHLELEFGDNNDQDDDDHPHTARAFPPDLDLANVGSDFDLSDVDKSKFPEHLRLKKAHLPSSTPPPEPTTPALSQEQLQQLALLRFLNPNAAIPQVITTSKPVLKLETIYESHVIPIFNGQSTILSTLSRPIATVSKTEFEYGTSTLAMPQHIIPSQINPLFPQQQQQFTITSTPIVTQTMVTATESKVLKLTFGAKTAYTTLFSTRVVPTVLTTYLTASVPVQPTAQGFPGFFPAPYNPFSFVG